jgi:polyisoprenoid-binding protein YceI
VTRWLFEPGHTAVGFRARHMMVTWVRGKFRDVHGEIDFDWERCLESTFRGRIDATELWTGEPTRDAHLRSSDFFDVENYPEITFEGRLLERTGATAFTAEVDATVRGTTLTVPLDARYLGQWETPFWVGDENKGLMRRIGFEARSRVNRHDFGVSWQDEIPGGGVVAGNEIDLVFDVEAIAVEDLERTGAIEYYREVYSPHCGGVGREAA